MEISKLLTYSFSKNVGPKDRVFRIISGITIAVIPLFITVTKSISILLLIAGLAWMATGIVSRCGAYYLLGLSTRKKNN